MPAQDSLVIFFHGIGASGAQLMPLATSWRTALPNSRFAAPDAPFTHWRGHQWFLIDGNPLAPENIRSARDGFDETVADIIREEGFGSTQDRVAFVGVSQGAIVALDAVASGRWQVGALVSFAGLLPPISFYPRAIAPQSCCYTGRMTGRFRLSHQRWRRTNSAQQVFVSKLRSCRLSGIRFRRAAQRGRSNSCSGRSRDRNRNGCSTFFRNGK